MSTWIDACLLSAFVALLALSSVATVFGIMLLAGW